MTEAHESNVVDMWTYIGRKAQRQNKAFIDRARATGQLEPHYAAYERLAEIGGFIIDMEMPTRPNLQLVVTEDLQ